MPQCIKCKQYLHPDFCVDVVNSLIDESDNIKMCVFCRLNLKEVTIQYDDGSDKKITKQEAINKYKEYLNNLTKNRKIESLIKTGSKSRIIMPGDKDY